MKFTEFLTNVEINPGACWIWKRAKGRGGYGTCWARYSDGRTAQTPCHRFMWENVFGPIPKGLYVCHRCDNPPCCNPDHLFLGTTQDNTADRCQKGRRARIMGEKNPAFGNTRTRGVGNSNAKISDGIVLEIRRRHSAGETQTQLAKEFGINQSQVSRVVHGVRWKHVGQ